MGFIKWPQYYAAEAEKIKGGIFNDRKRINVVPLQREIKQTCIKGWSRRGSKSY